MKKILLLFLWMLGLITACSNEMPEQSDSLFWKNSLIAYFSCTGNTAEVAHRIAAQTESVLYEIIPLDPYTQEDLAYETDCRANREQNDPTARPAISATVEDMSKYDIVMIGYPIWWGKLPKIIYTFMDTYDLSGKTILPFCTSGGSDISMSVDEIRQQEGEATVLEGKRFSKNASKADINAWLKTIANHLEEKTKMQISIKNDQYEIIYQLNGSLAAKELVAQLPLTVPIEPFSNNEMIFYPPRKLNVADAPFSDGQIGSLSYYAPWGDVVLFYAPCPPNNRLYEIGEILSGTENIHKLTGTVTISVVERRIKG